MKLSKLKPCPFCGKDPAMRVSQEGFYVLCDNYKCNNVNTKTFKTNTSAFKKWNRRVKEKE